MPTKFSEERENGFHVGYFEFDREEIILVYKFESHEKFIEWEIGNSRLRAAADEIVDACPNPDVITESVRKLIMDWLIQAKNHVESYPEQPLLPSIVTAKNDYIDAIRGRRA